MFQGIVRVKGGEKRKKYRKEKKKKIRSFRIFSISISSWRRKRRRKWRIDSIAGFSRKGKGDVRKGEVVIITIWKIFELIIK